MMDEVKTKEENQEINLLIKRGLLDNRQRKLTLNKDFIRFEDKDLASHPFTQINKVEITGLRYGIKWINGYQFTIGREYQIFIAYKETEFLKIHFKTFYGIRKKELHNLYAEIVDALWKLYFEPMTSNLMAQFRDGNEIKLCGVHLAKENITIETTSLIKNEKKVIPWDKVETKNYWRYFAIYSIDDPANINRSYEYLDDWNTAILYSLVRTILNDLQSEKIIE